MLIILQQNHYYATINDKLLKDTLLLENTSKKLTE